jgi:hypothetical protein
MKEHTPPRKGHQIEEDDLSGNQRDSMHASWERIYSINGDTLERGKNWAVIMTKGI